VLGGELCVQLRTPGGIELTAMRQRTETTHDTLHRGARLCVQWEPDSVHLYPAS
jgi:hypothetical protein